MTWRNRIRLLVGLAVVAAIVAGATLVLNRREGQVSSVTASIKAVSYSVGSDYPGTVIKQDVQPGDRVAKGDPILSIQSAALATDIATRHAAPSSTAYKVATDGTMTLIATQPGVVSKADTSVGGFVGAGQRLVTIDRSGSLTVRAEFRVDPTDFARIERGAAVDIVLPNYQRIPGRVHIVHVHTVAGQADAVIEVTSDRLVLGGHDGLVASGTPVTAILHLRDDGPFAGVSDSAHALMEKVGL